MPLARERVEHEKGSTWSIGWTKNPATNCRCWTVGAGVNRGRVRCSFLNRGRVRCSLVSFCSIRDEFVAYSLLVTEPV